MMDQKKQSRGRDMGRTILHSRVGGHCQRCRILQFVQEFARREGYSPSYREIAGNSDSRCPLTGLGSLRPG